MRRLRYVKILLGGLLALCALAALPVRADVPVTLFRSFAGNLNFEGTGGTLRAQSNAGNFCLLNGTSTATMPALTPDADVQAVYLYYAASSFNDTFVDTTVNLTIDGTANNGLVADRTFLADFVFSGVDFDFYSGFVDITGIWPNTPGQKSLVFSGLTVDTGFPHCNVATVMAGFSVVVIYEDTSPDGEPLRVINVFDGFQDFRDDSISLTPANFRTPSDPADVDGKQLVITWEGDAENSGAGPDFGITEGITFNGDALPQAGDPFNAGGINPTNNDFNSTIGAQGITTSYGVDVDFYDLTDVIGTNATSGTTVYSSGADRVLLSAEVISVTNVPVTDLEVTKTGPTNFLAGRNNSWTITVTNNGPNEAPAGSFVVDDVLAGLTGVTYVSAGGTDWSCALSPSQVVTCSYDVALPDTNTTPVLTLEVFVDATAAPSVTNTATVRIPFASDTFDNQSGNNSDSVTTPVLTPSLSATKAVVDPGGGDVLPGDMLQFTITLQENDGVPVTGVRVTDTLAATLSGLANVTVSVTATDASDLVNGVLDVQDITVPAGGTVEITFDAVVAGSAGEIIVNTATIDDGMAPFDASSPSLTIAASQFGANGDKPLYLRIAETGGNDPAEDMGRALPTSTDPDGTRVDLDGDGEQETWDLAPALVSDLVIDPGLVDVVFYLTEEGGPTTDRELLVTLERATGTPTVIASGIVDAQSLSTTDASPTLVQGTLSVLEPGTVTAGESLRLRIVNQTGDGAQRVRIWEQSQLEINNGTDPYLATSRILVPTSTVINVDTIGAFDASFGGGGGVAWDVVSPGDEVFLRAVVSDPFGTFDITGATLDLEDANGGTIFADLDLGSGTIDGNTVVFEQTYTVTSPFGPTGDWLYSITAQEGLVDEGIVHTRNALFEVGVPNFTIVKSTDTVISDPVLGVDGNAKRLPGAVVEYEILVTNQGRGRTTVDTVNIRDNFPANLLLAADSGDGTPIQILTPNNSDLTFFYDDDDVPTDDVTFFDGTGADRTQPLPAPVDGCYAAADVGGFRVNPKGRMAPALSGATSFTIRYRACIP